MRINMSADYEIFEGKTLSNLFQDIYKNSETNKKQLEVLIKEVVGFIKDGDTAVQIIPMIKEYLEINVKNDEQLVKLATLVQKREGNSNSISNKEKEELFDLINSDLEE